MKRIILLTTLSLFVLFAQSQITKGSILLGGGLYFGNVNSNDPIYYHKNRLQCGISPSVGIAVKENLIYGASLAYSHLGDRDPNYSGKQIIDNYYTGLFIRKYLPLGKGFYLFGEPSLGFNYGKNKLYQSSTEYDLTQNWDVKLNFYPGISYAVSKKFHLETGLGNLVYISYGTSKTEYFNTSAPIPSTKGSGFMLNSSLGSTVQLNVGLRFLIAK